MIVYGDPSFRTRLVSLVERFRRRLHAAEQAGCAGHIPTDAIRALLIEAGQIEQAAADAEASADGAMPARLEGVTDAVARAFVARCDAGGEPRRPGEIAAVVPAIRAAGGLLDSLAAPTELAVRVKVPEGFAFYALYPEQYVAAAERWLAGHARDGKAGRAVVVGVRSIGTSLSAVVAAVLARAGWRATRITVRPTGHPYARHVALPADLDVSDAHGLIVDEGPGHSGSSMAAAGQALAEAGMDRARVSFLPGHAGPPGHAASDAVRAWWDATPRHVVALEDLRWGGLSLRDVLAERTAQLCGQRVARVDDLGGGAWRGHVYADPQQWPAAYAPFERPKYRYTLEGGGAVLWKFAGLAAGTGDDGTGAEAAAAARLEAFAAGGWVVAPLGSAMGFVATPWVDGRPLVRSDATPDLLAHVGRYIAAAAAGWLDADEQRSAFDRLAEMLYWNTRESLGEEAAERTRLLADAARRLAPARPVPPYGDGRLEPHEWLQADGGRILKTDAAGHDADHTAVGRQPVVWDVAGAMVEWGLDESSARPLLDGFRAAGGRVAPLPALSIYVAAYAAFRVGMCSMCAAMCGHDPAEQARLRTAEESYKGQLTAALSTCT